MSVDSTIQAYDYVGLAAPVPEGGGDSEATRHLPYHGCIKEAGFVMSGNWQERLVSVQSCSQFIKYVQINSNETLYTNYSGQHDIEPFTITTVISDLSANHPSSMSYQA